MPHRHHLAMLALLAGGLLTGAQAPAPRPATPSGTRAAAEMVTEANLSRDGLKAVFAASGLPAAVDAGGNLMVTLPQAKVFVLPAKDHIRLLIRYGFAPRATLHEKLDFANRLNDQYIMARASISEDQPETLAVDYTVIPGPGISRAALVATTRRFGQVVEEAIGALDTDRLIR